MEALISSNLLESSCGFGLRSLALKQRILDMPQCGYDSIPYQKSYGWKRCWRALEIPSVYRSKLQRKRINEDTPPMRSSTSNWTFWSRYQDPLPWNTMMRSDYKPLTMSTYCFDVGNSMSTGTSSEIAPSTWQARMKTQKEARLKMAHPCSREMQTGGEENEIHGQ